MVSMELPTSTTRLRAFSRPSLCPHSPNPSFNSFPFRHRNHCRRRLYGNSKSLRVELSSEKDKDSSGNGDPFRSLEDRDDDSGNIWEDSDIVEVFGIGSRKDGVLDFCLASPFLSPALRFWNILVKDSGKVQLQQRFFGKDISSRIVEAPLALQSCSKAVILVASAAYGSEHITVLDILKAVKSANGLVVGVILKPFSFEGRRRQNEVKDLVDKLQGYTNFCIVVDTDTLLEKDLVTLDEALKTANNAVLMAINAISILISDMNIKILDVPQSDMKKVKLSELKKILERYKEAKIGFGVGCNIKTSIVRAIYDCPFLDVGVKDMNGIVVCILASSGVTNSSDVDAILHTFRQTIECKGEIVLSTIHEPNLENNLILTTVITVGDSGHATQKSSIFSRLAQHLPFIFNLLKKRDPKSEDTKENNSLERACLSEMIMSPDSGEFPNINLVNGADEGLGVYSAELQTLLGNSSDEIYSLRDYGNTSEQSEVEFSETNSDSSTSYDENSEGAPTFRREPLMRRNLGTGYQIAEEWAIEGANISGATPVLGNPSICKLPVGVKRSEELNEGPNTSSNILHAWKITKDDMNAPAQVSPGVSWDMLTDNASALLKGNYSNVSKKQGVLSVRAASMLEAERDSKKKWNPTVEMKYRGGVYRGRCQGGLPEGKGQLSLVDGSIYDGMWRYGKRSGLGTFYFSNGDVFQGSWRDDAMHGKGWFYFHTGDRWFVNFWKGKANGEGRFYSKLGGVFFGHFKNGWRHGHFLCINVDGVRFLEVWDQGVLVSHKQLDSDAGGG